MTHPIADDHPLMNAPAFWASGVPREDATVLFRFHSDGAVLAGKTLFLSASQRFRAFGQGVLLDEGPARGDLWRWGGRKVALPDLPPGPCVLAIEVWHAGEHSGIGQLGPDAFLLATSDDPALAKALADPAAWRCQHARGRVMDGTHHWPKGLPYFPVGAGERLDAASWPWGWEQSGFTDATWEQPRVVAGKAANPWGNLPLGVRLCHDPLPSMRGGPIAFARVVRGVDESGSEVPDAATLADWLAGRRTLTVPPGRRWRLALDAGHLVNAVPTLAFSGGAGANIRLVWGESGYDPLTKKKGRRDALGELEIWGFRDEILPDGGADRAWTPPWMRSFRFLELHLTTAASPLTVSAPTLVDSAFPLTRRADLGASEPGWTRVIDAAERTLRRCAHETFFDCPHYEQAQFPGDTPVQARIHYLLFGEERLARKAIDDLAGGLLPDGGIQCRYPSRQVQILPTYSLYWIELLADHLRHVGDRAFTAARLWQARAIVEGFARARRTDGLPGLVPHAPFTDWAKGFTAGNAPQDADGGSAIIAGELSRAANSLAHLEKALGFPELAPRWRRLARDLNTAIRTHCWDAGRGLVADTPSRTSASVHTQVEAVLAGALSASKARTALLRADGSEAVIQPGTLFYQTYLARARRLAGLRQRDADAFNARVKPWLDTLDSSGLTTFPESLVNWRSDCHGWSASPILWFIEDWLGVSAAPEAVGCDPLVFDPEPVAAPRTGRIPVPGGSVSVVITPRSDALVCDLDSPLPVRVPALKRILAPGQHQVRIGLQQ